MFYDFKGSKMKPAFVMYCDKLIKEIKKILTKCKLYCFGATRFIKHSSMSRMFFVLTVGLCYRCNDLPLKRN